MRTILLFTSSDGLRTERDITYDRKAHKNKGIVSKAASNRLKAHKTRRSVSKAATNYRFDTKSQFLCAAYPEFASLDESFFQWTAFTTLLKTMNRSQSGWTDNYATDQGSYGYDAAGNLASDSHKELRYGEQFVYEKQRL